MGEKTFTVTADGREARYRAARFVMTDNGDLLLFGPRRGPGNEELVAGYLRGHYSSVHESSARLAEVAA